MIDPFHDVEQVRTLAQAIVNTIPDPFLVLDESLRVLAASRSFYATFNVDPQHTRGCLLYALGDGQWDVPALRVLLETIIPRHVAMEGFEVEHDFPTLGRRVMLLNARQVIYEKSSKTTILLAFKDVTSLRKIEREKEDLLAETERLLTRQRVLLRELQHRVGNCLQLIANILLLKAAAVTSGETRGDLQDAYERVLSVAAVQSYLHASDSIDRIEVDSFLKKLCGSLASSLIGDGHSPIIEVLASRGTVTADEAVNVGLIVTELVINAIKHAFPTSRVGASVTVSYEIEGSAWQLIVSDNGAGKGAIDLSESRHGFGTTIIDSLVKQLGARMDVMSSIAGLRVTITSPTFVARLPQAA